ncbi:TIGR02147 family protein [Bdellovibrionota bacterium FG-2]
MFSIFNYASPRQFLLDTLSSKQKLDPEFSVRKWAKEMELKSHTLLVMLLQGTRPLRVKHAAFLAKGLRLSSQEKLYLQALIQFEGAEDPEEKSLYELWLSDLNPGKEFRTKEVDEFMVISHWAHMAILAMTQLRDFESSAQWIHSRFKTKVEISEINAALTRLLSLGLLVKNKDGKLEATFNRVTTRDDVASAGARKYHQEVLKLAGEAIEKSPITQRESQSFALSVSRDKIPLAKEMIRKFRAQFAQAIGSDAGNEVYQMTVQFFQLTESPIPKGIEDEGGDTENNPVSSKKEIFNA